MDSATPPKSRSPTWAPQSTHPQASDSFLCEETAHRRRPLKCLLPLLKLRLRRQQPGDAPLGLVDLAVLELGAAEARQRAEEQLRLEIDARLAKVVDLLKSASSGAPSLLRPTT